MHARDSKLNELVGRTRDDMGDVRDGTPTTIGREALGSLRGALPNAVCLPGERGYDEARTLWKAMIDRCPGAVVSGSSNACNVEC